LLIALGAGWRTSLGGCMRQAGHFLRLQPMSIQVHFIRTRNSERVPEQNNMVRKSNSNINAVCW
jgi:hypothetical protein